MTTTAPAEAAVSHHRPVTWVTGIGDASIGPYATRPVAAGVLPPGDADHLRLSTAPAQAGSGQTRYGAVIPLLTDLIRRLAAQATPLVRRYADGLAHLDPSLVPGTHHAASPLDAHAVTFAIIRRISRESLESAVRIDQAAMFLRDAIRSLADSRPTELWIPGMDLVDRPSLRVINRLIWLMEPSDRLRVVCLCRGDPFAADHEPVDALPQRRYRARRRLLERLAREWEPDVAPLPGTEVTEAWLPAPDRGAVGAPAPHALTMVAEELVSHNYDRAYLLAEALLPDAAPELGGELWRLVGLCDANIGEPQLAADALRRALDVCARPTQRAHLHYLRGLLLTKRHYDLDAADAEYRQGLTELAAVPDDTPPDDSLEGTDDAPFERAWLLNGRALVASLAARQLEPPQRTEALHDVLRQELAAFQLVTSGNQPRRVYLRYNLLANIAFVLEMAGQFDTAIDFWHRAFGQYVDRSGSGQRFETVYRYRTGLLEWKAGRDDRALAALRTAASLARQAGDRFHAERVQYALGFVLLEADPARAVAEFRAGLRQAWQLRDPIAVLAHARGLHHAAHQAGRPRLVRALRRWLRLTGHPALRTVGSEQLARQPERPAPKLPAYIPGIDLEPTPEVNLNVYLAAAAWDRARPMAEEAPHGR